MEEQLVSQLFGRPGIDLVVIPHLYDLKPQAGGGPDDSTSSCEVAALRAIPGDIVVCSWLYPRAAYWILHRLGIGGQPGSILLATADETNEEAASWPEADSTDDENTRVLNRAELPPRTIYNLDLRAYDSPEPYIEEVARIASEQWPQSTERQPSAIPQSAFRKPQSSNRRWYPVIDFGRCTNCLECIDFCLFGVYGLDEQETILVEQPDLCRTGCPACSRVCPEQAIMFPQHKTPSIAGSLLADDGTQPGGSSDVHDTGDSTAAPPKKPDLPRVPGCCENKLDQLIDAIDRFDL